MREAKCKTEFYSYARYANGRIGYDRHGKHGFLRCLVAVTRITSPRSGPQQHFGLLISQVRTREENNCVFFMTNARAKATNAQERWTTMRQIILYGGRESDETAD